MANAMLDDEFKSSQESLTNYEKMKQSEEDDDDDSPRTSKDGTRKTVDFAEPQPPPKHRRPSNTWSPKQVVDGKWLQPVMAFSLYLRMRSLILATAISTSISLSERLEAITNTRESFDHNIQHIHDDEMSKGADAALVKHLTFLVWQHKCHSHVDVLNEVALTCEALECLYRASSRYVGGSFRRMGMEILGLLVFVVDEEIGRRLKSVHSIAQGSQSGNDENETDSDYEKKQYHDEPDEKLQATIEKGASRRRSITPPNSNSKPGTPDGDLLLQKAIKIMAHCARVAEAVKPMASFPGLLGTLINLVTLRPYEYVPWEARLSALWTIANLACQDENMQMLVSIPGLIGALVEVACRPLHPGDSLEKTMEVLRSREIASRAILNLSWAPENKILLSENIFLVDLLTELSVHRTAPLSKSHTVRDILIKTRRHAVGAIRNLAAAPRRTKIALSEYKSGRILDVLTDVALNDIDVSVKDRAFAAIHNLAIHDTAEKIVNHPALVLALKDVLLSEEDNGGRQHQGGTPKSHASATLMVLERTITPEMRAYSNLRELLDAVNPNPASDDNEDEVEPVNATAV